MQIFLTMLTKTRKIRTFAIILIVTFICIENTHGKITIQEANAKPKKSDCKDDKKSVVVQSQKKQSQDPEPAAQQNPPGIPVLPPITASEDEELRAKISKITRTVKYRPFEMPKYYNRLQVPNYILVHYLLMENHTTHEEVEAVEASGKVAQSLEVKLRIKFVTDIDEISESITFAADLILRWNDSVIYTRGYSEFLFTQKEVLRLTPSHTNKLYKTMDPEFINKVWRPDIFIENMVKVQHPKLMSMPVTVRLNELTGQIIYMSRIRVQMECEMDFHYYPADTQTCQVVMRSNAYSKEELLMDWGHPFGVTLEHCEGSSFDHQLTNVEKLDKSEEYLDSETRQFSALGFSIVARRKLSYHIVQTFLPSIFFIVITWLCFLIPSKMAEARIGVAMTTLLTLTAMFAAVRENSPQVTYVRAIDIWMLACISFVFLTLLEFTLLLWARQKGDNEKDPSEKCQSLNPTPKKAFTAEETAPLTNVSKLPDRSDEKNSEGHRFSDRIDKFALILFPFVFILFCVSYWTWLLRGSGYFNWNVDPSFNCASD